MFIIFECIGAEYDDKVAFADKKDIVLEEVENCS